MVAGPNGAGKTTLTKALRLRGIDLGEYINPDDIAEELQGSYEARVARAQALADLRREACIAAGRSFSFETVMSHPSKIDTLERAKAAGFFVQLFFVGIDDPRTSIDRVASRVAQGGHDVPLDRIVPRWHRTMGLLARAIATAHRSFVFDNSNTATVDTTDPRLIVQIDKLQDNVEIMHHAVIPAWVRRYAVDPLLPASEHVSFIPEETGTTGGDN
jgi:predicted ABC-type ATPase